MATQTEELRTVLTVDGTQASAELRKYASELERFSAKAEKAEQRAASASLRDAAVAGTAIGAGFGLAFREAAREVSKLRGEQEALNVEISKATKEMGHGAFPGAAELKSDLNAAAAALQKIEARREKESSGVLGPGLRSIRQAVTGDSDEHELGQEIELRMKIAEVLGQQAEAQERLNAAKQLEVEGKAQEADMLRAEIKHKEKLQSLDEERQKTGVDNPAGVDAENKRFSLEQSEIAAKHSLIASEIAIKEAKKSYDEGAAKAHQDSPEAREKSKKDSLSKEARNIADRDKADEKAKQMNEKAQRDYDAAKDAKAQFEEGQFQKFQQVNGDWSGYKQQQRDDRHARAVYDARRDDYAKRRANGAYGQSGPDAEVFGSNPSMDGWDKVVAVMREVWGKN